MSFKIYDSVHGFIRFNDLERALIDSLAFQRLHYIHQLGIAFLVYPGATHTRFEHSLGVMELATRIFERIIEKKTFTTPDIDFDYWKQIVRLAALCHDFGHLPFSHVAEKILFGEQGHEKWTLEIIKSHALIPVWEALQKKYPKRPVLDDIIKMSIGETTLKKLGHFTFTAWERVLCQVVTGDFFGADRIDYLLRDAKCTGVSYGLFDYHQLIEMLCILPVDGTLELGIEENGIESCEALLLARHFMHKRVYQYASVRAYSFHLARFIAKLAEKSCWLKNPEEFLLCTDNEIIAAMHKAARDPDAAGHLDAAALTVRHLRFRAIPLAAGYEEKRLEEIKRKLKISDVEISWEVRKNKSRSIGLGFSALTKQGRVVQASSFSEITIPLGSASWVYVAPEHEKEVASALQSQAI